MSTFILLQKKCFEYCSSHYLQNFINKNISSVYIRRTTNKNGGYSWGLVTLPHPDTTITNELASINDLHDWVAATGQVFQGTIYVKEGFYQWFERGTDDFEAVLFDGAEEYTCGYELVEWGDV
ncbi:hypothetical protein EEL31_23740 [Brevibacillus laterosporus]|nr:hypothetical protein [Brevibacillus laterosporus]TPG71144.1 hypothetical protein EEL31_23740 [Brevibacillus laterosporus]